MNPRLGKVNRGGQVASCNNNSWSSSPRSPMQPEPVLNTVIVLNVLKPKTKFFTEYKNSALLTATNINTVVNTDVAVFTSDVMLLQSYWLICPLAVIQSINQQICSMETMRFSCRRKNKLSYRVEGSSPVYMNVQMMILNIGTVLTLLNKQSKKIQK